MTSKFRCNSLCVREKKETMLQCVWRVCGVCVACVWRVAIAEAIGKEDDGKEEDEANGRKQTNKESLFVFKNN